MGKDSWGVFLQIFLKISFENKKSPPDSSNREERVFVKLLDCKLMCRNFEKTVFPSILEDSVLSGHFTAPPTN